MKKNVSNIKEAEIQKRSEDSKYLKHGDVIAIANTIGYSKQAVHAFITGKTNSQIIKKVFDHVVTRRKESLKKSIEKNIKK